MRPGPLAEARLLGRWASSGCGVWSDALWAAAIKPKTVLDPRWQIVLGCDVARYGEDFTAIHVRFGPASLHHERHNGWDTGQTAGRLKELCREYAAWWTALRDPQAAPIDPTTITCHIDDDGLGGGVVDQAGEYAFHGVCAGGRAADSEGYPNRRSELWFSTAERARRGLIDFSRLSREILHRLQAQFLAPTYRLDAPGRRVVEPKDVTKEKLGHSPDDADATNLAFLDSAYGAAPAEYAEYNERNGDPRNPYRRK